MATLVLAEETAIPGLGLSARRYTHPSGFVHWHLACDDEHRAFCLALRTPPDDSTGLPHALEHIALCGSRRYPVRDPFFSMLRRSLQTFMNAMTWGDHTAYPFATQVEADYRNLARVYLDAVFAPSLDARDAAQEGFRLDLAGGNAARQGVVYNEMKGAMEGVEELVGQAAVEALLPGTCYRHNAGGDPAAIPRLSHAALVAFHRRCYRPANALLTTYGAVDVAALHAELDPYLAVDGTALPPPPLQTPLTAPRRRDVPVPWAEDAECEDAGHASLHWCWGDTADLDEVLAADLLDRLLLGHAGAPLRLALEGSGLGRSIGSSGYRGSERNGLFSAELEGIAPADYPRLEPLVLGCLERIAASGVPASEIAAALHQLELARREIRGDHAPFGLELALRVVKPWCLGVDPRPFLDPAAAIERLTARVRDPAWLGREVRTRLLANPHRVAVFARPDRRLPARTAAAEAAGAQAALVVAGEDRRAQVKAEAAALLAHQQRPFDTDLLPRLTLADIPARRRWSEPAHRAPGLTVFAARTNGLVHHLLALPLPDLPPDGLNLLPLVVGSLGQLGIGRRGYAEQAARQNALCAGLGGWLEIASDPEDAAAVRAWLVLEVRGLAARSHEFLPLLTEALEQTSFDERDRLAELVDQDHQRLRDQIANAGSALAGRAALRGFPGAAGLAHRLSGLGRLAWLRATARAIEAPEHLVELANSCRRLLAALAVQPRERVEIGDGSGLPPRRATPACERFPLPGRLRPRPAQRATTSDRLGLGRRDDGGPRAYTTASAVNHVALAFTAPPLGHADAPACAVAAQVLTNLRLHPLLREQGGAYGGGARWSAGTASLVLSSYRDPRLGDTLHDMRSSLAWLAAWPGDARDLEEAILGVISGIDAPASPAGEARGRFIGSLTGAEPARLDRLRAGVLAVRAADVRAVAARWLRPEGGVPAAITSAETLARSGLGWESEGI